MRAASATAWMLFLVVISWRAEGQTVWRESTIEDFRDGSFSDGGANTYVSANGRIQTINRYDANGDGYIDLLFANSHSYAERPDMTIYWGNGRDFDIRRHVRVPADGPRWIAPADLDGDGAMDLVVANRDNGTYSEMDLFLYYGGTDSPEREQAAEDWSCYPFERKETLPNKAPGKPATGDLDRDGDLDIVIPYSSGFSMSGQDTGEGDQTRQISRIYWGEGGRFDGERFTELPTKGANAAAVADLNGDDWPEIIFANGEEDVSFIYWNGEAGFLENQVTALPTHGAHSVAVGDLDNDGLPDVAFANQEGEESWAYLNRDGSFDAAQRIAFETQMALDCVIEDFNRDGMADIFFSNHEVNGNRVTQSFLYYGSGDGFVNDNRLELTTIGAWGASAADLNGDGWPELVVSNFQDRYTYEVPSFVYWNSPRGINEGMRTPLFEHGARGNAIADFNGDGFLDIAFANTFTLSANDYHPNYLYYGNEHGSYSAANRIELLGLESQGRGMADLDDDGDVDIVFGNQGEGHDVLWGVNDIFIYWNEDNQYDFGRRTGLPAYQINGLLLSDMDRDGYIDIISANHRSYPGATGIDPGVVIYWGGPDGFIVSERSALPADRVRAPAVADLDRDGNLDIIFGNEGDQEGSIFYGDGTRSTEQWRQVFIPGTQKTGYPNIADLNRDGFLDLIMTRGGSADETFSIYYGNERGEYTRENAVEIGTQAKTVTVADVNRDGWLDIVCAVYWHRTGRDTISHILLGSASGFSMKRKISLPTNSSDGSIVSDFNLDGYNDVFFYCHRSQGDVNRPGMPGDHKTASFLYWGGAAGFQADRRLEIPGLGVHARKGSDDLGDIYNRKYDYEYISSPYELGEGRPISIDWSAREPHRSAVRFQVRAARTEEELGDAEWIGPAAGGDYITEHNESLSHLPASARWIQYKAILHTDNGAYSPVLESVEIRIE